MRYNRGQSESVHYGRLSDRKSNRQVARKYILVVVVAVITLIFFSAYLWRLLRRRSSQSNGSTTKVKCVTCFNLTLTPAPNEKNNHTVLPNFPDLATSSTLQVNQRTMTLQNMVLQPGVSYNLPKFSSCASWNSNGITFADHTTVGTYPFAVFIDNNNTVYVSDQVNSRVQVWREGSVTPTRTLWDYNLIHPLGLFVTSNGDILVSYSSNNQVRRWSWNTRSSVRVIDLSASCFGLFIDKNNNLYCSLSSSLQVVMIALNNSTNMIKEVMGDGSHGLTRNELSYHYSIFVDFMSNLYVADCASDSVLLFFPGQSNGIIVAGIRAVVSFPLHCPTGVALDLDRYLFIVDSGNNRIVQSGLHGFRCVVGCSGTSGSGANQLNSPFALSFDSYGNIFVTDQMNSRVQKLILATNSCATE